MLELIDVDKSFDNGEGRIKVLNQVSLRIKNNEFVAIMGSSGSGKSTLMNLLGCLDTPDSGRYLLDGRDVSGLTDEDLSHTRNQRIGFIFQTFHLLPRLSALENVCIPLRYCNTEQNTGRQKARDLLTRVGLEQRMGHLPFEMSGGQRQRVAIARALINEPHVILADEPTGNLDSQTSLEIMQLLTQLHQQGQTIVMVTHEREVAEFAQRVIYMKDGQIIDEGQS